MIKRLGEKILNFGASMGKKISEGIGNLGRKMYDNRYKIIGGLASAALVGGGLYAGSQNKYLQGVLASQRENRAGDPWFVRDDPLPQLKANIGQHPLQRGAITGTKKPFNVVPFNEEELFRSASDIPFELRN